MVIFRALATLWACACTRLYTTNLSGESAWQAVPRLFIQQHTQKGRLCNWVATYQLQWQGASSLLHLMKGIVHHAPGIAAIAQGSLCSQPPRKVTKDLPQVPLWPRSGAASAALRLGTAAGTPGSALLLWCHCRRTQEAPVQNSELPEQRKACKHKQAEPNIGNALFPAYRGAAHLDHDSLPHGRGSP